MSRIIVRQSRAKALRDLHERGMMPFMGGAPPGGQVVQAAVTSYPLGPPTVQNESITVDMMLNNPTRVTRLIQDISLERFMLDYLFRSAGGVTGGAVIYDQPTENDLYLDRDIARVEPGGEFPILTSSIPVPKIAEPEKWGGKVFITDEARDRNDSSRFTTEMRKLSNTITRKLNQRAVQEVTNVLTAYPGQTIPGNNWTTVTTLGTNPTPYADQPVGDFVAIALHNELLEIGMEHDTLIMHPNQAAQLRLIYGTNWRAVLAEYGYSTVFVTQQITAGTALSVARGQLGELRIESPLATETWREQKTQRTWVQSSVRPLMFINDPFAVVQLTGLAG